MLEKPIIKKLQLIKKTEFESELPAAVTERVTLKEPKKRPTDVTEGSSDTSTGQDNYFPALA